MQGQSTYKGTFILQISLIGTDEHTHTYTNVYHKQTADEQTDSQQTDQQTWQP